MKMRKDKYITTKEPMNNTELINLLTYMFQSNFIKDKLEEKRLINLQSLICILPLLHHMQIKQQVISYTFKYHLSFINDLFEVGFH